MKTLRLSLTLLLCSSSVLVGSCGIKPDHVDPPSSVKQDTFPNTYPNVSTDPAP